MNKIDSRPPFFPRAKNVHLKQELDIRPDPLLEGPKRNSNSRADQLKSITAKDAKVNINQGVKDYSRIRRAVEHAAPIDNSAKITQLKSQINSGEYQIDYDAVADRLLSNNY